LQVAILTVGDEVLAGDIQNTNASWLAGQLTDSGARVARILTVPDERETIAEIVADWRARFDAVIVTGGLGGTHDDVTVDALAQALGTDVVVHADVREDVIETIAEYRDRNPDVVEAHDLDLDVDAWAALPADARPLINPEGLCPGCVAENVYAFPGIPDEMQALFEQVGAEFGGDTVSRTLHTPQPEASLTEPLLEIRNRFDVTVGSYPSLRERNRIKVLGTDEVAVESATRVLRDRIETADD
jgi:molybdenum cofactor synthesis domain-containing protein